MDRVPGTTQLLVAGGESNTNLTISPILIYQTSDNNPMSTLTTLKLISNSNSIQPQNTAPVSLAKNPPALARHTMTLTSSGQAIILGGITSQGVLSNLTTAYVMDTQAKEAEWKAIPLQGKAPNPRIGFSTVMVNTTTLLVFGGTPDFKSAYWVTFYLDLPTWTWSSPTPQGDLPHRWGHTSTMVGNIMVVTFGLSFRQSPDKTSVALLDTTTNTWISQFTPLSSLPNPVNPGDKGKGGNVKRAIQLREKTWSKLHLVCLINPKDYYRRSCQVLASDRREDPGLRSNLKT
ncbi:Adagio protein 3 [Entomortierella beljakovae]|nr:Adagio protein 3 [Entomortierella beljakovae]